MVDKASLCVGGRRESMKTVRSLWKGDRRRRHDITSCRRICHPLSSVFRTQAVSGDDNLSVPSPYLLSAPLASKDANDIDRFSYESAAPSRIAKCRVARKKMQAKGKQRP